MAKKKLTPEQFNDYKAAYTVPEYISLKFHY